MSTPLAFGLNVVIVISEFNPVITESLLSGAMDAYITGGGKEEEVKIYRTPGAYEIPGTVKQVLANQSPDVVVTLGAVIRGETPHFDYICQEVARGIGEIILKEEVPVSFGVLTTDTIDQALSRASKEGENKGKDAAICTLEMIHLIRKV